MLWLSSLNQAMVNFVAYPAVNLGTIQLVTAAPPKCGRAHAWVELPGKVLVKSESVDFLEKSFIWARAKKDGLNYNKSMKIDVTHDAEAGWVLFGHPSHVSWRATQQTEWRVDHTILCTSRRATQGGLYNTL